MRALIWKDYRLNRTLLILGFATLAAVYLLGAIAEISYVYPAVPESRACADAFVSYGVISLHILPYVVAVFGGNAIACERADRSAHFLAYLPPTRRQIVASKLIVAIGSVAALWIGPLLSVYVIGPRWDPGAASFLPGASVGVAAACCVLTFGVGWLGSACLERATIPVLVALASPIMLSFGLLAVAFLTGISRFEMTEWAGTVGLWAGLCAFSAGTWCYLGRVEP